MIKTYLMIMEVRGIRPRFSSFLLLDRRSFICKKRSLYSLWASYTDDDSPEVNTLKSKAKKLKPISIILQM